MPLSQPRNMHPIDALLSLAEAAPTEPTVYRVDAAADVRASSALALLAEILVDDPVWQLFKAQRRAGGLTARTRMRTRLAVEEAAETHPEIARRIAAVI